MTESFSEKPLVGKKLDEVERIMQRWEPMILALPLVSALAIEQIEDETSRRWGFVVALNRPLPKLLQRFKLKTFKGVPIQSRVEGLIESL